MAGEVKSTTAEILGLVEVMKELGLVTKTNEKGGGIFEKGQRKIKKTMAKSPYVKAGKAMAGYFKSFKQLGEYTVKARSVGDEKLEQMEEEMSGLTKLTATLLFHTGVSKMMNKVGGKTNSMFGSILMKVLSLVVIFAMVAFAIGMVVLAFQGADSPLLALTDGVTGVDNVAQGLVLAFTGEGEGGLYGAMNLIAAAATAAGVVFMLFGGKIGLLVLAVTLVVGTFQLVNKEFDNIYVAITAATAVAALLAAGFLYLKIQAVTAAGGVASAWMVALAPLLIAAALIMGGLAILFLFATGELSGWLGWAAAGIAAFAIAAGVAILFGFTWPLFLIVAAVVFIVAVVYRYWDEIVAFFKPAIDIIIAVAKIYWAAFMIVVDVTIAILVGAFNAVWWVLSGIISVFIAVFKGAWSIASSIISFGVAVIMGVVKVIAMPFKFAWKWIKRFFSWLKAAPKRVGRSILGGIKWVINKFIGLWNMMAKKMSWTAPDWVPVIGGETIGLPTIPKLAKGGIVRSPTLAMIGEAGPEAVVPLSGQNAKNAANQMGLGGGGGGPITITVNAGGITDRTDKRALAREIGDAIRDEMYRSGRSMGTRRGAL